MTGISPVIFHNKHRGDRTMKRILFASLLGCTTFLTSCEVEVHWNGEHLGYLPWYMVWVPLLFACFVVLLIVQRVRIGRNYRCPICQTEFTPKWYEFSVLIEDNAGMYVCRCPNCHRKGFCKRL